MPEPTDAPASLANRFTVLSTLGEGGMGLVYRAEDRVVTGREVAVKVIKGSGEVNADQRLRFMAEFRAMARLRHPNTVEVLDYGQLECGNLYIAMELVPGRELGEAIGGKPMPLDEAYRLLIQLLQALDFVHSRGYVHRDIKAANVRVTPDGTLKLMDFGLMGQIGQASTRQVTGSPGYLAPEVAQGGTITASSDLYSVGCLAYEMLTGKLPFEGKLIEVVRAHVQTPAIPLRQRRPDAPEALEKLVMRMLEKEPARRYRTAGLVLEDLAALAGVERARETLDQQLSFLETGEIIGRDAELARLDEALEAARAGRARPLFVSAPAGTGKSRLVQELVLKAKLAGFVVMRGDCHEDGMAPYEALVASLRAGLPHGTEDERRRYLPTLARLFPEKVADEEAAAAAAPDAAGLADAVRGWLADLAARTPVLWLLDDLHWADVQTVEVFNHVLRELAGHAVLAIGTFRNDETPAGSPVWRTLEDGDADAMALAPLGPAAQAALVGAMLPDACMPEAFAAALDRATGGNPFFVTEVLRSLVEDGHLARRDGAWRFPTDPAVLRPLTSMEATVKRRLGHLGACARDLLGVAAVLGHAWDPCTLKAVTELDDDTLFCSLEELVEHHFLAREDACTYRFPHDRVREVTYDELDPEVRREAHRRAGLVLEAGFADDPDAHAHELARHFLQGGDGPKAYHYLMAAAAQADATGADATAIDRWRDAERVLADLDLPGKAFHQLKVWMMIGWNGFVQVPEVAREMLRRAVAVYDADPVAVGAALEAAGFHPAELFGLLGIVCGFCGRPGEARDAAAKAAELTGDLAGARAGAVRFVHVGGLMPTGRFDELVVAARKAQAELDEPLDPVPNAVAGARVGAVAVQNAVAFQGVRPDPAIRDEANRRALANRDENPFTTWFYFGLWAAWTGRQDDAQAYIDMTAQKSRRVGGPPFPWVLYLRPYLLWQRGELALGLEQVEKALLAYPHLRQSALAFHHTLALRGHLLLDLGRRDEAAAVFADLEALARERELGLTLMMALQGHGRVAGAAGLPAAAREAFEALHALAAEGPLRNPLYQARAARGLGLAAMALGDWEGAAGRFAEALAIATRPEQDNLFLQAHLHRDRGKLHLRRGEREAATRELSRAGELFHGLRNPFWLHAVMTDLDGFHERVVPKAEASPEARWQLMRGML